VEGGGLQFLTSILQKLMVKTEIVVMASRFRLGTDDVIHQLQLLDTGGGWWIVISYINSAKTYITNELVKMVVMVSRLGVGCDVVIHQLNWLDPGGGWWIVISCVHSAETYVANEDSCHGV
jgi:hypothetical protein